MNTWPTYTITSTQAISTNIWVSPENIELPDWIGGSMSKWTGYKQKHINGEVMITGEPDDYCCEISGQVSNIPDEILEKEDFLLPWLAIEFRELLERYVQDPPFALHSTLTQKDFRNKSLQRPAQPMK